MTTQGERMLTTTGRVLLSLIFLGAGFAKISEWSATAGMMLAKGMPEVPLLLTLTIVVEVAGGLAVLSGVGARAAAVTLALFLVPATLVFHDFWHYQGAEFEAQQVNFMKNLAIMGGLLVLAGRGTRADRD
jgi:putative oxidoreductase